MAVVCVAEWDMCVCVCLYVSTCAGLRWITAEFRQDAKHTTMTKNKKVWGEEGKLAKYTRRSNRIEQISTMYRHADKQPTHTYSTYTYDTTSLRVPILVGSVGFCAC